MEKITYKMFREKSWNEKTEFERFQTVVDWVHEILWGTPRRPEVKFEGMMTKVKPKRKPRQVKDVSFFERVVKGGHNIFSPPK